MSGPERTARAGGHTSVAADFQSGQHRPREPLPYDELKAAYVAALKREVQLLHENSELMNIVLHLKGRLMTFTQEIDFQLADHARTHDRHAVANDVATVKVYR